MENEKYFKSDFMRSITGEFGEAIQIKAENEMIDLVMEAKRDAVVEEDGAIKWKSNEQYLPDDCCEILEYAEYDFNRIATSKKRMEQIIDEIKSLCEVKQEHSEEELAEMKNEFGEGKTVVNILTGERIAL